MITWLNHLSPTWLAWMISMLWQSAILVAIVWLVDLAIRRFAWPQLRYALWLLVFVKLVLPPGFALPTSLTSGVAPFIRQHLSVSSAAAAPTPVPVEAIATPPAPSSVKHVTISALSTSPASVHPIHPAISWQTGLMLAWLAGIAILSMWLCLKLWRLRGSSAAVALPEWFPSVLRESADRLSLKRLPAVIVTPMVKCPAVLGATDPLILMPQDRLNSYTRDETANMLIHELAHIKRGDLLIHAVQLVLQVVYWPNVLLWLVRRPIHDLRELCCDTTVAATLREKTASYRQTLLDTARILIAESADPGLGLLGLFERPHAIVTRLNYLEQPLGRQTMCKIITPIAVVAMLICVLPMSLARAETTTVETTDANNGSHSVIMRTTSSSGPSVMVTKGVSFSTGSGGGTSGGTTSSIMAFNQPQNIDANAIEFRIVWTAGKDLLPDEVEAIKDGTSPLFQNKECLWADVDPNATMAPNWVTRKGEDGITEVLLSNRPSEIMVPDGSWTIKSVTVNLYPAGRKPDLGLDFDTKGSSVIHDLTSSNLGRPLAIVVHGRVVSAPMVQSPITDKAMITGNFTVPQLNALMQSMMVSTPIRIEAHVITAPAATMQRLLKQVGAKVSSVAPLTGTTTGTSMSSTTGTSTSTASISASSTGITVDPTTGLPQPAGLTDEQLANLLAALPNEPDAKLLYSPTVVTPAEQKAAIVLANNAEDAQEEFELNVTPHLNKGKTITLIFELKLEKVRNEATKDIRSVATVLTVQSGKLAVVSAGGTDNSMTYIIVKAIAEKR